MVHRGILSYSKLMMLNIYSQCIAPVYLISLIVMCLAPNVDTGDPHCQIKFATQKHTFFLPYFSFSRPLTFTI